MPSRPLPLVQRHLPADAVFLSVPDAAPGPAYTAKSRRFTPARIQGSYGLTPLYDAGFAGQGRTIAIVDSFGYDQAASDLKTFSQAYGLPLMCGNRVADVDLTRCSTADVLERAAGKRPEADSPSFRHATP